MLVKCSKYVEAIWQTNKHVQICDGTEFFHYASRDKLIKYGGGSSNNVLYGRIQEFNAYTVNKVTLYVHSVSYCTKSHNYACVYYPWLAWLNIVTHSLHIYLFIWTYTFEAVAQAYLAMCSTRKYKINEIK